MKQKFSERMGFAEHIPTIQTEGMNPALRNSLWNLLLNFYKTERSPWLALARWSAQDFFKVPLDELPDENYECIEWVKRHFYKMKWFEVYDFIEYIAENYEDMLLYPRVKKKDLETTFNSILQRELSGYRLITGVIAPISNPAETGEISTAIESSARSGLDGAHEHLLTALKLLGKKPEPDYRNSIKESISAVESIAKQLSESGAQGLKGALDELEKRVEIHAALQAGFVKLYGFTSNEDGIRHAILEQPNVGFAEAKYMIVSCSAFVHYLIEKAHDAGLLKRK